jgi:hypothetical protein
LRTWLPEVQSPANTADILFYGMLAEELGKIPKLIEKQDAE